MCRRARSRRRQAARQGRLLNAYTRRSTRSTIRVLPPPRSSKPCVAGTSLLRMSVRVRKSWSRLWHRALQVPGERCPRDQARERLWLIVGFSCAYLVVVLLSFRTARVRNQSVDGEEKLVTNWSDMRLLP